MIANYIPVPVLIPNVTRKAYPMMHGDFFFLGKWNLERESKLRSQKSEPHNM
jgi:hypothetical protein